MFLEAALAYLHAIGIHHAAGEFQKCLGEDTLGAVAVDDALVVADIIKRADRLAGNSSRFGLLPDTIQPIAEGAMPAFGGRKGRQGQKENGQAGQASNRVSSHGYSRAKRSAEWELKAPAVKTVSIAHAGGPLQQFFGRMALLVHRPVC